MERDLFIKQNDFLSMIENSLGIDSDETKYCALIEKSEQTGFEIPDIPDIDFSDFSKVFSKLPEFEYALLPRWRVVDIPVMICAGFLGALISLGLHDVFDKLHMDWGTDIYENGGHGGQIPDKIRGLKHRLKYGHDVFNPFEIEWDKYFPAGTEASLLKKVCAWLKHLFQDTFSTEGLPLPGNSYFRDVILKLTEGNYNTYKAFFTIKARDAVGTTFIASAMSMYVYGTEIGNERKFFNYRYTSLSLGALVISICVGISMAPQKASMNYFSVAAMIPYIVALAKVNNRLNQQIKQRNLTLQNNKNILQNNNTISLKNESKLDTHNNQLDILIRKLTDFYNTTSSLIDSSIKECSVLMSDQEAWLSQIERELNIPKEV